MLAEVGLEVICENGLQGRADLFLRQRGIDSVNSRHPRANDSIREATVSILIFRAFSFQQLLHFAAVFTYTRDQGGKRCIPQPQVLHSLLEIFAIEELLLHEACTAMGKI